MRREEKRMVSIISYGVRYGSLYGTRITPAKYNLKLSPFRSLRLGILFSFNQRANGKHEDCRASVNEDSYDVIWPLYSVCF